MKERIANDNVSGVREQNTQDSPTGLKNDEVRNLNNEAPQPAPDDAEKINSLVEGVPSGISTTISAGGSDTKNETFADRYWKQLTNPQVRNADNELLGATGGRGFTIGYVEEVNGPGAEEMQDFLPTRHELVQLAKYWAKIGIDIDYFWFCYQQTGSTEMRLGPFAWRRVNRIADILGVEVVKAAVDKAYEEYGKDQDPRTWHIFLNGTSEERTALQDEIARKICGDQGVEPNSESTVSSVDPADRPEKAA